ncbi:hypothetical protein BcepSauron_104 [Burkholderia phage BcepSauron]|uniref:Uncharacterized protein n=1 Tax=Burkholderia phage BcepSauron TaxID=2530033 RepID=A0A482ML37_9CAUD|nr:hypothetical protein H1O17_gp104 [Burkholderia phage BcepSauron]QBQ74484.1 hypothetical protein BcepSauron_104 [Burkholderia phage BcepSauron]
MQQWILIYSRKDPKILYLVLAWSYEFDDYSRASRNVWEYEDLDAAKAYAYDLADQHGLTFIDDNGPTHRFLD